MPTCFVIQPFTDVYNKRFDDLYKPAIESAGMTAYRVDQDTSATVLVEAIERNIKQAAVCLADITEDNPNVWYELGFAFAAGRPVVMACSDERSRMGKAFPFDIRHRAIVTYKTESSRDFLTFKENLATRLKAMLEQGETLDEMAVQANVAAVDGLTQQEVTVLGVIASSVYQDDHAVTVTEVRNNCERVGLNGLGINVGLRGLKTKALVVPEEIHDENTYHPYLGVRVTDAGWAWITANEAKFTYHTQSSKKAATFDDDIPF
jgi:nucleoside 2-deoxyribosyltransferase